jgi:hypothetical protein
LKEKDNKGKWVHYAAMWGCMATGLVYLSIGLIAVLSFLQLKQGGADEGSLLVYLDQYGAGKVLVWIIMLGMLAFITWRLYETVADPYHYGRGWKGLVKRSAIALSSLADALIAYSAVQALLGLGNLKKSGQPVQERNSAQHLLNESWGSTVLCAIGIVVLLTAIVQLGYVINKTYRERLDAEHLQRWKRLTIETLAWYGHFARGVILGIVGFFLVKAALSGNAQHVVNTDKAFDFIGDEVGHFYFILVAIGTICYGLFMMLFGVYYDSDKD